MYSKCSITDSRECVVRFLVMVVCGAASTPITPPRSAQARSTSSGANRFESHSARAPMWLSTIGLALAAMVSSVVWSPQCEQSISIPTLFIRSTARRPKLVSPPSLASLRPVPSALDSL